MLGRRPLISNGKYLEGKNTCDINVNGRDRMGSILVWRCIHELEY
jgi:hypothetical protein